MLSENWATLWESLASAMSDQKAIVIGDQSWTWGQFDHRASCLATSLIELGVHPGDCVAQLLFNSPEYLESVYAALKVRAAPTNINHRYLRDEIVHVLTVSKARVLVFHASLRERVREVKQLLPQVAFVQVDDEPGELLDGAYRYNDLMAAAPMAPMARSGDDELVLFTGGTTGLPKGVVWGHSDLFASLATTSYAALGLAQPETVAEVGEIAARLRASGASPVNVVAPPLMHGTALFLAMGAFVLGGTVVLLAGRRFDPHEVWSLVEREQATQLSIVGDAFARPLAAALTQRDYDLTSLQRVTSTGLVLSAPVKRALTATHPMTIIDMIGASEGGPFAINLTPPGGDPGDTAAFTATPRTVLIDPDTGTVMAFGTGEPGILAVSGVMPKGYLGDAEATARTFRMIDGVRYSVPGDLALVDANGAVTMLGRGSGCINSGGEKIYAEEVENVIRLHPDVRDANVVGLPDERLGEQVCAVVSGSVDPDALTRFVKERLAAYKAPRRVVIVDEIVRSPSGKSDYRWAKSVAAAATESA
jgi:3-oxocholest-4-en-26-oate---CoA ligase